MRIPVLAAPLALALGGGLALSGDGGLAHADTASYVVSEARSSFRIQVGKSGAFSFAGHRHEVVAPVSGTVIADAADLAASRVDLAFASAQLRVVPDDEPEGDAPKVESVMRGPKVLDVLRFPQIRFRSKQVRGRALPGGRYELSLVGELSLHGVTREIAVPVAVALDDHTLTASGKATLRHDEFGMVPVTAAGGIVKVANEIHIDFEVVAER